MIGVGKIGIVASRGGGTAPVNPDFVIEVDTTQAGSASDTIILPLEPGGTYSGTIDWGDGNSDSLSYANRQYTYASGGTYTITISGDTFEGFRYANGGDKAKLIDIQNWGFIALNADSAFRGCSNMDISATDAPTIITTSMYRMFMSCVSLTNPDFSKWDVSAVTDFREVFRSATNFNGNLSTWDVSSGVQFVRMMDSSSFNSDISDWQLLAADDISYMFNDTNFNQDISSWNVSNITNMSFLFGGTPFNQNINNWDVSNVSNMNSTFAFGNIDQSFQGWDITNVSNFQNFCRAVTLSTVNYDALLVDWEATLQSAYPGGVGYPHTININFYLSKYTLGSAAESARTSLISNFGWTITDGGGV